MRVASARGVWSYCLPLNTVMASSMLYELVEWGFARLVEPAAGTAFLGAQGDDWDAQKDMALASCGAILAMGVVLLVNARTDPRFRAELAESLRVKRRAPLGEVELQRRARGRDDA